MELSFYINGVELEGVDTKSLKLTIQNSDPLRYSERSVAYSGSIKVPRTSVNDAVFVHELSHGLIPRKSSYIGTFLVGGLPLPINNGKFSVRCTASESGYTLDVLETFTKFNALPSNFGDISYLVANVTSQAKINMKTLLNACYGTTNLPTLVTRNSSDGVHVLYTDRVYSKTEDYLGNLIPLEFVNSYDTPEGVWYVSNLIKPSTPELTALVNRAPNLVTYKLQDGATIKLTGNVSDENLYLIVVAHPGGTTYPNNYATFTRYFYDPSNNTTVYIGPSNKTLKASGGLAHFIISKTTTGAAITAANNIPIREALQVTLRVSSVTQPSEGSADGFYWFSNIPFTNAYDALEAMCKTFMWTYRYNPSDRILTVYRLVDTSLRFDWTGKIKGGITTSEVPGIAKTIRYRVGDLSADFSMANTAFTVVGDPVQSNLPVRSKLNAEPSSYMIDDEFDTSYQTGYNYFFDPEGYTKYLTEHYKLFRLGIQSTFKAKVSYWDIKNFKQEGAYWFGELNGWYYLRSISNWNVDDNIADIVAIRLSL